jgi:DNA polymerase III gamma/tau subunit
MRRFGGEELALRWSRGSIGFFKTLDLVSLRAKRDAALEFLETAVRARDEEFRNLISVSAEIARAKNEFESNMGTLAVLLEDMMYLREGVAARIINVDIEPRLKKLSDDVQPQDFARIADFLRTIEVHLNNYGNRQMLTDVLAITSNTVLGKIANDNPSKSR